MFPDTSVACHTTCASLCRPWKTLEASHECAVCIFRRCGTQWLRQKVQQLCSHVPGLHVGLMPVFIKTTLTSVSVKHSIPAKCRRSATRAWSASWSGWRTCGFWALTSSTPFYTPTAFSPRPLWCWRSSPTSTRGLSPPSRSGTAALLMLLSCWLTFDLIASEEVK